MRIAQIAPLHERVRKGHVRSHGSKVQEVMSANPITVEKHTRSIRSCT